jgi:L-lysine exporter family protein LysE/ArgO
MAYPVIHPNFIHRRISMVLNLLIDSLIGILLGVSLAAPPGPVTAMIVRKAASSVSKAFSIGLGAMTADLMLMLIVFFLRKEIDFTDYDRYIYMVGALFLFFFAYEIFENKTSISEEASGSYFRGLTVGIVNPLQIGWWLSVGLSFLAVFGYTVFYFIFIGIAIWVLALSSLIRIGVRAYGEVAKKATRFISIALLVAFGIYFAGIAFIKIA